MVFSRHCKYALLFWVPIKKLSSMLSNLKDQGIFNYFAVSHNLHFK